MLSTVEVNQDETSHNHDLLSLAVTRATVQWLNNQFVFLRYICVCTCLVIHLPAVLYKSVM